MEKKSIGSFLTALRKTSGMTQKQLAEKLNVSDKAVSRWERDECAPDLSLIPVLAEIYSVTSDEILRGQRIDPEKQYQSGDKQKVQKQRNRILCATKTKFLSRSLITVAVMLVGLILAYIFNFEFAKANTGFLLGCIFFIAALVCQVSFLISGFSAVTDEEWQDSSVASCKGFMLLTSQWVLGGITTAFAFCVPLAGSDPKAVPMVDCTCMGIRWALIGLVLTVTLSVLVNALLKRRGTIDLKLPLNRLRVGCSLVLAIIYTLFMGLQICMNGFLTENRRLYAPYDTCTSLNSFKTLMEDERSEDNIPMYEERGWSEDIFIYTVYDHTLSGDGIPQKQYILEEKDIAKQLIETDKQPNLYDKPFSEEFGYRFRHVNQYVPYYEVSDTPELLPIYTFNTEQLAQANSTLIYINLACLSLYLLAAAVTGIIYSLWRKKL